MNLRDGRYTTGCRFLPREEPAMIRILTSINASLFRYGSCLTLVAMTLLTGLDAILRYVAGMPIIGAYDLVGMGLLLTIVVALPDSLRAGCHVRMDIFYDRYGPVMTRVVDLLTQGAALAFGGIVAWRAIHFVPVYMQTGEATITLRMPVWPFVALIALSCVLFCLSVLATIITGFKKDEML